MEESIGNLKVDSHDLLRDNAVYLRHINSWAIDISDSIGLGIRQTPSVRELSPSKISNNAYLWSADEILYKFNWAISNDSVWREKDDTLNLKQSQYWISQYLYQLFTSINQTKAKEPINWNWQDVQELNSLLIKERLVVKDIIIALLDKIDKINWEKIKTTELLKSANDQIQEFKVRCQILK